MKRAYLEKLKNIVGGGGHTGREHANILGDTTKHYIFKKLHNICYQMPKFEAIHII